MDIAVNLVENYLRLTGYMTLSEFEVQRSRPVAVIGHRVGGDREDRREGDIRREIPAVWIYAEARGRGGVRAPSRPAPEYPPGPPAAARAP